MLTRIEIDGFKTFEGFALDLSPFLVVLGPNGSGKSNLFDAIRLLSRLAAHDLREAVAGLRGEPHELFRRDVAGSPGSRMRFAVEVLVPPSVRDPWGDEVSVKHSRLRYAVEIVRVADATKRTERLLVAHESATPISKPNESWRPWESAVSKPFQRAFMKYSGRQPPYLSTSADGENGGSFEIHQDGHQGRKRPARAAEATILSSIGNSKEFPHLFALREELRSWRFLQVDPTALRRPSSTMAPEMLEPDASNLPTVLARIEAETKTKEQPKGVLADIAADLTALIPGVADLSVEPDTKSREFRVDVHMRSGPPFSARVVSDGTLRVLALLALLHDPKSRGLVCFEEPENGVHPVRLKALLTRLRELVVDPTRDADAEDSLLQLLLNSHSPVVLSTLRAGLGDVVFADVVDIVEGGQIRSRTRMRPVRTERQGALLGVADQAFVTRFEVENFLATVDRGDG